MPEKIIKNKKKKNSSPKNKKTSPKVLSVEAA